MLGKLGALWISIADATKYRHDYIVYAKDQDSFDGFVYYKEHNSRITHRLIAKHANEQRTEPAAAGSFNFLRVKDCIDLPQAIMRAKMGGLHYDPSKVVVLPLRTKNASRQEFKTS